MATTFETLRGEIAAKIVALTPPSHQGTDTSGAGADTVANAIWGK
jgi:hypothetical protein